MYKKKGVLIVTGSCPPMRCGVGDYAYNLASALSGTGTPVYVYTSAEGMGAGYKKKGVEALGRAKGWGLLAVLSAFRGLKKDLVPKNIAWVNIQYPTIGYGYSLGPQLLCILLKLFSGAGVISTLHEFRSARLLRKISLIPFLLFSDKIIFTADEEVAAVREMMPPLYLRVRARYAVIPVGSNVPAGLGAPAGKRAGLVVFFGLFYPGRCLELVAEIFQTVAQENKNAVFGMIGDVHPKHSRYYEQMRAYFETLLPKDRLEWHIGESSENVARILACASAAVLPYPDGASFRRTTLMAAMMSGVPALSTKGPDTPAEFRDGENILFAYDRSEFAKKTLTVLSDPALAGRIAANARELSREFSWDKIAARYVSFIRGQNAG